MVDSNKMLSEAIEHLFELDRRPDLVLLTGDLVDEGLPDEYEVVVQKLRELTIPHVVLMGNHDRRSALRKAFPDHTYLPKIGPLHYCLEDHPLRIIALDSCVPGEHYGHIDSDGLDWLEDTLKNDPERPTLVALHHPPFFCGIPHLDKYRYVDHGAFASVISSFSNIEAILCGHVHRPMFRRWAGTIAIACPSTATQIGLRLATDPDPVSYGGPPACLLHLWDPHRGLISHISFMGEYPGPYPFF